MRVLTSSDVFLVIGRTQYLAFSIKESNGDYCDLTDAQAFLTLARGDTILMEDEECEITDAERGELQTGMLDTSEWEAGPYDARIRLVLPGDEGGEDEGDDTMVDYTSEITVWVQTA